MIAVGSSSSLRVVLGILILVCGQSAMAQQLHGKVVVAQGGTFAVLTDSNSRNLPGKLFKVSFAANARANEVGSFQIGVRNNYNKAIALADLKVGDHVMLTGSLDSPTSSDYLAKTVTREAYPDGQVPGTTTASPSLPTTGQTAQTMPLTTPPWPPRVDATLLGRVKEVSGNTVTFRNGAHFIVHPRATIGVLGSGCLAMDCATRARLADIGVDDEMTVYGSRVDGSFIATMVRIESRSGWLQGIGKVVSKSGNSITVATAQGEKTVTISDATQIKKKVYPEYSITAPISLAGIQPGAQVSFAGRVGAEPNSVQSSYITWEFPSEVGNTAAPSPSPVAAKVAQPARPETAQELQAEAAKIAGQVQGQKYVKCGEAYYSGSSLLDTVRADSFSFRQIIVQQFTEHKDLRFLPVQPKALSTAQRLNGIEWTGSTEVSYTATRERSAAQDPGNPEATAHWSAWSSWSDASGGFDLDLTKKNGDWSIRGFKTKRDPGMTVVDPTADPISIDFTSGDNPKHACFLLQSPAGDEYFQLK